MDVAKKEKKITQRMVVISKIDFYFLEPVNSSCQKQEEIKHSMAIVSNVNFYCHFQALNAVSYHFFKANT